jgi:low temperature requirement protein LtrA
MASVEEELEQPVSPLELFFDLVFVFAITQVSAFVSHDAGWTRLFEGIAILAALWFAWESYVWLANTAASDEGIVRVVLLSTMGALLIASLAVPHAFGEDALVFGVAYFAVRAAHIAAYVAVSRGDPQLRVVVVRLATTFLPAAMLLVLAGVVDGRARTACWIAALAIDYVGLMVRGVAGWRVNAAHLAERHGLIVIIALGESIVAVGVGAAGLELDAGSSSPRSWAWSWRAGCGGRTSTSSPLPPRGAAHRAARRARADGPRLVHLPALPMVAGIVLFAVGAKKTLAHIDEHLDTVPAVALCGGAALYLVALSAFKRRNLGSWNVPRLMAASALVVLAPIATAIPRSWL